ncbi:YgjP-like metallopeptidase domain-containing protein, partial [Providencia manganoxydans]|uniref:YgjP-like metallopeptidase domain-containing protein n=1 Tax=Providencia manganoxydans TaxID=2923283 RepID=UPI0034E60903
LISMHSCLGTSYTNNIAPWVHGADTVKAPKECIDYVILHELCHIAEHNHSEKFWRLLTSVMPNWKEVKSRLDGMAELYLSE